MVYPPNTGRNFEEILRVIDNPQITGRAKVATPVNWRPGERGIIPPSIPDEQARALFPQGWEARKPCPRPVEVTERSIGPCAARCLAVAWVHRSKQGDRGRT